MLVPQATGPKAASRDDAVLVQQSCEVVIKGNLDGNHASAGQVLLACPDVFSEKVEAKSD